MKKNLQCNLEKLGHQINKQAILAENQVLTISLTFKMFFTINILPSSGSAGQGLSLKRMRSQCSKKSISFTSSHKWEIILGHVAILWVASSIILFPKTDANLLSSERKMTSKTPQLAAVLNLLPLYPKNSKKKPGQSNLEQFQAYLDFIVAYSTFKKWEAIYLVLPTVKKSLCAHFKVFFLKANGIISTCLDSQTFESSGSDINQNRNKLKLIAEKKEPLVVCHFVSTLSTPPESIHVNQKLLIENSVDIFVVASNFSNAEKVIDEIQPEIAVNYKWTLASRKNESNFQIEDIYGIVNSAVAIRNPFGFWNYDDDISIDYHKLVGPQDFQGRTLRITTQEAPPVVYAKKSNGRLISSGYLPNILEVISSKLNFKPLLGRYILSLPPDNSYGSRYENGTWSGMVGVLQRKEAEMALTSFSYTPGRKEVMDFSPPVEYSSTRLLIRKDRHSNELKWKAYSEPFDWQVWLAIPWIVVLGVTTFVAFTHYKLMQTTPSESAWFLSACFLQQGLEEHNNVRRFPCRLVLGSFWVLAVVLYASYTARLTSFLAASTDMLPIKSLAEAVDNNYWKIGMVQGTAVTDRVKVLNKESKVPEFRRMWKKISQDTTGYVSGFNDGIEKVYDERYIFFTSDLVPSFLIKGNCSYSWIPGKFFPGFGYMGYPKNLPFKASISIQVARIRETGQMKRLFKKWWGADSSCSLSPSNVGFTGMSLFETGTAFLLLIFGFIFATIFLLVELYIYLENPFDINTKFNNERSSLSAHSESSNRPHKSDAEYAISIPEGSNTQETSQHMRKFVNQTNKFKSFLARLSTHFRKQPQDELQPGNSRALNF